MPARVPSFEVSSLGNRQVNIQWEPVPIPQQYGLMQYYEIAVGELKATYKGNGKALHLTWVSRPSLSLLVFRNLTVNHLHR